MRSGLLLVRSFPRKRRIIGWLIHLRDYDQSSLLARRFPAGGDKMRAKYHPSVRPRESGDPERCLILDFHLRGNERDWFVVPLSLHDANVLFKLRRIVAQRLARTVIDDAADRKSTRLNSSQQ